MHLLSVAAVVLLLQWAPHPTAATFLTDREAENQVCTSSAFQIVARVSVQVPPVNPIDVITIPGTSKSYSIDCVQSVETLSAPNALVSSLAAASCDGSTPTFLICQSDAALTVPVWKCTPLTAYQANPRQQTIINAAAGTSNIFKVQWKSDLASPNCFPRDVTVMFVGHEVVQPGTQIGASIAFIIIVLAVGIVVVIFGAYLLRKVAMKFSTRDEEVMSRAAGLGPYEAAAAAIGVEGLALEEGAGQGDVEGVKRIDFYSAEDIETGLGGGVSNGGGSALRRRSPGNRGLGTSPEHLEMTTVTDRNEVLVSQPLPKPWYQRANYDGSARGANASRNQDLNGSFHDDYDENSPMHTGRGAAPGKRPVVEPRRLPMGQSPADDGRRGRSASELSRRPLQPSVDMQQPSVRAIPLPNNNDIPVRYEDGYYDEDDEDVELTCTDCRLPIRDHSTPQHCAVTGKRHY